VPTPSLRREAARVAKRHSSRLRVLAAVILVVPAMTSCTSMTMEPAPFRACGQEIGNPSGIYVERLHPHLTIDVYAFTLVVLVKGCSHGAVLSFTPASLDQYVQQGEAIKAKDGKLVAVVVEAPVTVSGPVRGFITVERNGVTLGTITLTAAGQGTTSPSGSGTTT
jgi:hypothetical protein